MRVIWYFKQIVVRIRILVPRGIIRRPTVGQRLNARTYSLIKFRVDTKYPIIAQTQMSCRHDISLGIENFKRSLLHCS